MNAVADRPLRIAQIAPLYEAVPPSTYGGTERVIAALCADLVARGHDVTLFAAGDSRTRARLEPAVPEALRMTMTRRELEQIAPHLHLDMLAGVYAQADRFDVIHAHTDIWALPFTRLTDTPTVLTLHGRLDLDEVHHVLPRYRDVPLVSISDHQRVDVAQLDLRWAATCYNGLRLDEYLQQPRGNGRYLAFLGRITREKRPDWAVEIARRSGLPLRVAAKIDPLDVDYWHDVIEPLFASNDVEFIGEISEAEKPRFLADAAALVFPIDWPEPFGLVMIEAMAAGTPVIALDRGSVPEVVIDGESGFICSDIDQMVDAITRLDQIDPVRCRQASMRFSTNAMGERYLEVYRQVIAESARDATTAEPAIRSAGQVPSIVSRLSPVRTLPDRPRHRGRPDLAG